MRLTYTGRHIELAPSQKVELEAEFSKLGRALDTQKGEAEARIVLSHENLTNRADVSIHWQHHELVSHAEHADLFGAIHAAAMKLQKQAQKLQEKRRDLRRIPTP